MFANQDIAQLQSLIAQRGRVVIITHRLPDGDALGSSIGWMQYLTLKGCETSFVSPTLYTDNLKWIPGTDAVICYDDPLHKQRATELIATADVIYCLDFNALSRIEEVGVLVAASTATLVMIDHHLEPEAFAALTFSDTSYAATAEMVYDLIQQMGDETLITSDMATCIYTGLATDTGFFQHSNTSPNVFRVAAALTALGAAPAIISDKICNVYDERRLRYYGEMLSQKLKVVKPGKVAYISVPQIDARRFNLQLGDNEGLVNYPFRIKGVELTALFTEERDKIKISLRSKGDIDVNQFARKYFSGGGHKNAAGGKSLVNLNETLNIFEQAVIEIVN
jgi:bifunctional oligoribonuclease and PAP phosphatase NrnA